MTRMPRIDPLSLHSRATPPADVPRFLSREACRAVLEQVQTFGLVDQRIDLTSSWRGDVRWARNRVATASDWRDNQLTLGRFGTVVLNQLNATSLQAAVRWFAEVEEREPQHVDVVWAPVTQAYPQTHIWSEATYQQASEVRSALVAQFTAAAERAGMLSAGYLAVEARGTSFRTNNGLFLYAPQTIAQCSLTVRDPGGTGSGWAGVSSYDWGRIDAEKLAGVALEKCLTSRNPVKLEPGRYTAILEPQATYELLRQVMDDNPYMSRNENEGSNAILPFKKPGVAYKYHDRGDMIGVGRTRVGDRVFDSRLSIRSDPLDPDLGTLPFTFKGDPYVPVSWVERGVLAELAYDQDYALRLLHAPMGKPWSGAFRMEGSEPPVSLEEMIATTKRGLLITRFWDVRVLDLSSVLCTGLTRDGLWLVENGKISKPVQNFRFTESPMFAFNNVEQIGTPVPVFNPGVPAVVPAVKVRDFSFTSLVDAV